MLVNNIQELLVHVHFFQSDLFCSSEVVSHKHEILFFDGLLQSSDHLSFSLDQLNLLLHSVEVCVVEELGGT